MVDLTKRRVNVDAAKKGVWFENPEGFRGIAVKITSLDTDECIAVREDILTQMFGDPNYPVEDTWLAQYINARVLIDAAVKEILGLTNDAGKPVRYTKDYLRGILLTKQTDSTQKKTPDGLVYDPAAKTVCGMLLNRGTAAGRLAEGEEKKLSPGGFAGAGASSQESQTGETNDLPGGQPLLSEDETENGQTGSGEASA